MNTSIATEGRVEIDGRIFNPYSKDFIRSPWATWEKMVLEYPVAWHKDLNMWVVSSHDACAEMLKNNVFTPNYKAWEHAPPEKPEQTTQPDEPIYQVFMPPLRYDAKTKVQADFDPNLIILVRRVRVRPTLIFQGRVEGDPVVAHAAGPADAAKSHPTPQAPPETSTWTRVKTYFRKLWSPST